MGVLKDDMGCYEGWHGWGLWRMTWVGVTKDDVGEGYEGWHGGLWGMAWVGFVKDDMGGGNEGWRGWGLWRMTWGVMRDGMGGVYEGHEGWHGWGLWRMTWVGLWRMTWVGVMKDDMDGGHEGWHGWDCSVKSMIPHENFHSWYLIGWQPILVRWFLCIESEPWIKLNPLS